MWFMLSLAVLDLHSSNSLYKSVFFDCHIPVTFCKILEIFMFFEWLVLETQKELGNKPGYFWYLLLVKRSFLRLFGEFDNVIILLSHPQVNEISLISVICGQYLWRSHCDNFTGKLLSVSTQNVFWELPNVFETSKNELFTRSRYPKYPGTLSESNGASRTNCLKIIEISIKVTGFHPKPTIKKKHSYIMEHRWGVLNGFRAQ